MLTKLECDENGFVQLIQFTDGNELITAKYTITGPAIYDLKPEQQIEKRPKK